MDSPSRWGHGARYHDADRGKETLLNVAIECLARKGFRATTMQDVAAAAHVSRRTVYRYFSGKNDMLREAVYFSQGMAFSAMQAAAEPYQDDFFHYFEEAVVAGVRYYMSVDLETKAALTKNDKHIRNFLEHDWLIDKWMILLRVPYLNYIGKHPDAKNVVKLESYAELATLLVTGHCQLQSSEDSVRESFKNMMALSKIHVKQIGH